MCTSQGVCVRVCVRARVRARVYKSGCVCVCARDCVRTRPSPSRSHWSELVTALRLAALGRPTFTMASKDWPGWAPVRPQHLDFVTRPGPATRGPELHVQVASDSDHNLGPGRRARRLMIWAAEPSAGSEWSCAGPRPAFRDRRRTGSDPGKSDSRDNRLVRSQAASAKARPALVHELASSESAAREGGPREARIPGGPPAQSTVTRRGRWTLRLHRRAAGVPVLRARLRYGPSGSGRAGTRIVGAAQTNRCC